MTRDSILKHLYIGKSHLNFIKDGSTLLPDTTFGDLGRDLIDLQYITLPQWVLGTKSIIPNLAITGTLDIISKTFDVSPIEAKHTLLITKVPLGKNLQEYKFKDILWSSYYQDQYRGYLFQIIPVQRPLIPQEVIWRQ